MKTETGKCYTLLWLAYKLRENKVYNSIKWYLTIAEAVKKKKNWQHFEKGNSQTTVCIGNYKSNLLKKFLVPLKKGK